MNTFCNVKVGEWNVIEFIYCNRTPIFGKLLKILTTCNKLLKNVVQQKAFIKTILILFFLIKKINFITSKIQVNSDIHYFSSY